ncbi:winged helix-turn-helix domain-containing protein [Nitriliruptor alkaliphilus]|uniref:winged helix-turn-helix domain-containing protein n=1 Tax=Nitriliruptor alkaliphilus TaxID=427918 RepID=UPI000695D821|nr:crosslink repair DNA glycosylase YcaQ family protein [Nitriliruptor alkaliphilus]
MRTISLPVARRLALTAQGLDRPRPPATTRRDVRHLRRVTAATDIVQLDSVNVLARAHELPFWSRIGPHDRAARDAWLWGSRELYEGWIHVQSCTSVDVWPLLHHRRATPLKWPSLQQVVEDDPGYVEKVLDEVAANGPTSVADLSDPGARSGPWWGNPKGKVTLDYLHVRGDLAVHTRTANFVTVYDLAERIIPAHARESEVPPTEVAHQRLLLRAARAHGIATLAELADHHRLRVPEARPALAALVARGELDEVRVRGLEHEPRYVLPGARAARTIPARTLLSPFDPVVWHRGRAEALFGFRYRIEIYVPEAKRVHGYYVLPFLLGDRLVARVDLKADRAGGRLQVRGAFAEPHVDRAYVGRALAEELCELGAWLGVPEVVVARNGDLADALAASLG